MYLNIKMAYECTRSLTGVILFCRIPLGVQKTLLHGGGVASCGTYGHQSGPNAMPPTESPADPLCCSSRWLGRGFFKDLLCYFKYIYFLGDRNDAIGTKKEVSENTRLNKEAVNVPK